MSKCPNKFNDIHGIWDMVLKNQNTATDSLIHCILCKTFKIVHIHQVFLQSFISI